MVLNQKYTKLSFLQCILYIYTMNLIADSGSTKTNWCLVPEGGAGPLLCRTRGINPFYQNGREILTLLRKDFCPGFMHADNVYFYGAGCGDEKSKAIVKRPLMTFFTPESVSVDSDLMAAARALCQTDEGLACILGTGSNSCYYNGREIAGHVPSLGYILGDEGSGADIGRRLVSDILKNQVSSTLRDEFFEACRLTPVEILEKVYKNPFPNRFLATFTRFAGEHLSDPEIYRLVKSGFTRFFTRNIRQYREAERLPVHFTGSIAWVFADILKESAHENGFQVGMIMPDPMEGLIRYHKNVPL
jgi:N-acetylglucosamine kinase-like BadF-type ATPase